MHTAEPESSAGHRGVRIARLLLWLLGLLEIVVGTLALISAVQLFRAPDAGMALIFAPVLAIVALLLVAGVLIFVRRPWSRYVHSGVLLLIGLLLVVYVGPLLGPFGWIQVLIAVLLVVGPLTAIFRLAAVRRYFGEEG